MPSERVAALLTLQLRDMEAGRLATQLAALPGRKEEIRAEISAIQQKLFAQRGHLRQLEARRDELELETQSNEQKVRRFRTQQLEVKKNEEYRALEHEIAALEEKSDQQETEELTILEEIDQAALEFTAFRNQAAEEEKSLLAKIEGLETLQIEKESLLAQEQAKATAARTGIAPELMSHYDQLCRELCFPVAVPLVKQSCTGCHLRVSNEVEGVANKKEYAICDNCGRIVFVE